MPQHVGQRLGEDPLREQFRLPHNRSRAADQFGVDRQSGAPDRCEQALQPGIVQRDGVWIRGQAGQIGQCARDPAAGVGATRASAPARPGPGIGGHPGGTCLHGDRRDVMGDDIGSSRATR